MISTTEKFQIDALTRKVLNLDLTFHWIDGTDRFWFRRQSRDGELVVTVDASTGAQTFVRDASQFAVKSSPGEWVVSPDGSRAVLRYEDNLRLHTIASGAECSITQDGERDFSYGSEDINPCFDKQDVARRRSGKPCAPAGVLWSPDSRFIVAMRQDLRSCPERPFVTEYTPPDGLYTQAHVRRFPLACDACTPESHAIVYDTATASCRAIDLNPQAMNDYAPLYFSGGVVWWTADCQKLFVVTANRGGRRYALCAIDLLSGEVREVLHETARFNVRLNPFDYFRPNVHVTGDGAEALWYSERSGYGHLYLYDASSGDLKRQLTQGEWVVFDLLRVDEKQRFAYFTAGPRSGEGNPYYRHLYRVSLDGGEPHLLTPERADHKFNNYFGVFRPRGGGEGTAQAGGSISPSGRYFVDSFSTTDRPTEYVLRRTTGELITKILSADASALYASGWRPPERIIAKAADGITDLHGVITYPRDFDPSRKYAVIDFMYPGPQGSFAPQTFLDQLAGGPIHHLQTFADAGFIVVAIDGRGTAHRSRAFRDAFLGTEDVLGAADHMAALQDLAAQRPCMDLECVGLQGQSFGGYGSLRAMLLYPDFFKVVVSTTGPEAWLQFPSGISTERFFGVPSESAAVHAYYELISNARLLPRLKGRLLLIYAGIDENVPLKHAFSLFDALIKADKDFDTLIVPDSAHLAPNEPYAIRRSVQYFLEHLAGARSREQQT